MIRRLSVAIVGMLSFATAAFPASASDETSILRALGAAEDLACLRAIGARPELEWRRLDLDGNGRDEILLFVGGVGDGATSCLGEAGRYVHLMIRTPTGAWQDQFGFSASDVRLIPRGGGTWADIEIHGPGPCRPIWRYRGSGYRGLGNCR